MLKTIRSYIIICCLLMPVMALATHIVGGSLTYVYLGGSSYKVTLKLYRDCGSGTASFPGSVVISVLGNNGTSFSPSKDITMNLGTVTNVPSGLSPCAIAPNPLPCVQEGVYTTTVTNLPPNAGGYHLYYQIVARNLSLTNVNATCNCVGESFYAHIPGPNETSLWMEDFSLPDGTTSDNGTTAWSSAAGAIAPASAMVNTGAFEIKGANNAQNTWTSQNINISSCNSIGVTVNLAETGTLDPNDSIMVYYRINGGPLTLFPNNGFKADDFTSAMASVSGLSGNNFQIVIRTRFDGNSPSSEIYKLDNIAVNCYTGPFLPNSNPVFNLFPPLFLCVNQPFSFNHSATDADGDSLVYSLYTPYDGEAGVGPLDPTFPANTASFTPITFLGGFSTTSPLGSPLTLNPSTGLLSGTPTMIGQFVVGVMVKEYRNGVYLGETLRDFQFNVLNCPQPPPAITVADISINDGCVKPLIASGISTASATWNSIAPGAQGFYNNYLSCTSGCLSPTVTAIGTPPAYIDYKVCGNSISCAGTYVCDTVRVNFNSSLAVNIQPLNPTLCFGQTSTTLTAMGSGGTPPYTYLWNNVNPTQSIFVGVGTYNVKISDASGCPPAYNTIVVNSFSVPITANAGPDKTICAQTPIATIQASVTGALGGIWSGGTGTFSPNNTTLANLNYIPSSAELAAGSSTLYLTTTGNGNCPADVDTVILHYSGFTSTVSIATTNVSCYNGTNGSAAINISGGISPFTYTWSTSPVQTGSVAVGLPLGSYSVSVTDGIGCMYQTTVSITQPLPLSVSMSGTAVACSGGSSGSAQSIVSGGTAPYSYSWLNNGQTGSTVSGISAGIYTVQVTDSKLCTANGTISISQPSPLSAGLTTTAVSCYNGTNGQISSVISGGTAGYTYSWSPGGGSGASLSGIGAGTYTLKVTDSKGCISSQTASITQPSALLAAVSVTNESCQYLNNGSASVSVSGGTSGYTYTWQPVGQFTSQINNIPSGSYTVNISDSKGCTTTTVATVTEPAVLSVNLQSQVNVSCNGGNNGSAVVSGIGGTPNYTYSWSPGGSSSSVLSNAVAGTYTVTLTDSRSCQAQTTVSITQPLPLSVSMSGTAVACSGGSSGSAQSIVSGGTAPYSYSWLNNGQTGSSVNGISAGIYTVQVTDSKLCTANGTISISQPSPLSAGLTTTAVSCYNGTNGQISSVISGGTAGYTYSWSPGGGSGASLSGIGAGTYTLKVTDSKGCISSQTASITQPSALLAAVSVTNESCQYLNNGSASVNVSGGTPGYTYTWQPVGQFTSQINNIPSGSYTVNISDSKGCTTTTVATVTEPAVLSVNLQSQVNVSCNGGNNGSAVVSGIGGTPNYTYSWSPGGSSSSVLSNAVAGTYTVTLTDSRSCQAQTTVIITQPNVLTVSTGVTNVSCNGGNNGVISISSSGGTAPYAYTLFPGNIISSNFSSLSPGNYTVVTNDAAGCSKTSTVTINQPTSVSSVIGYTNANCGMQTGNASISITSGGVPPFTYQWLPAGGTGSVSTALAAGSYTVKVSDNNGCLTLNTVNINDIQGPLVSIASTTNVSCFAGSNGAAVATFTGGTGPNYTYQWFPSGGNSLTAAGLQSGYYTIKIIDNAGCIGLATTPFISEPAKIVPVISTQSVSCMGGNNGWATVNANGGTPSYSYLWQPTGQTGSSITNISAGNYTVLVTDSYSCVQTLSFTIAQPASFPSVTIASSSVSCFGGNNGSAVAQAIGGVSPYNFQWNYGAVSGATLSNVPAGIYSVSATDYNGCVTGATVSVTQPAVMSLTVNSSSSDCSQANGSASVSVSGGTGSYTYQWNPGNSVLSTAAGLFAGSYSIVVTDANACSITNSILITDKPAPTLNITGTGSVSCFGGSNGTATLSVSGGTGPFSYSWLPSGGSQPVASGLSAGTYTAQVVSANGCTVQVTTPLITAPLPVLTVVSSTAVACYGGNNGSAGISVSGGIPAYSYTWFPGGMSSAMVSGLTAGIYTVQTSDQNNCIQTTTVQVAEPAQLSVLSTTVVPVSCFGGNTGAASVSITGGTAPFNYAWLPVGSNGPQSSGLTTGTYSVSIHDANNCMTNTVLTVSGPLAPLSVNGYGNGTLCYGGSDGTATVTVAGGTPSYSYQWSPAGGTLSTASNLSNGNYIVTVTDGNNCQASVPIQIAQATPITGTLVPDDASCGLANGAMQSQINGGVGPYQYSWNNATYTTANISNLLPGTYSLQVMDANNCQVTFSASLVNLPGPSVNVVSTQSILCQGGNNGTATASITGTLVPYQFSWLPYGGNQVAATGLTAGTYTAQLIDAKGCTVTANAIIPEPSLLSITTTTVSDVSCFAQANGSAAIAVSGGSPGYSYVWSGSGATGPQATNLVAGNYSVTVHDQNNCSTGYGFVIAQPPALTSTLTGVTNALCYQSVGASTVSAAGGTMPYSYNWTSTPPQTGTIAGGLHAGNFTVTVTDANGCTSTKTLTITQPSQIITHTGINDTICVGQQATVVASASGGSGNYYYVWNPSGSINTGTYNPSPVSNTTYTVMAFDQNGCAGIEDSVDVTVYSLTGANVQVYGETPICPGQASQISATVMGNTGPCTLNWNNGLGSGPGPFVVQPSQPVTYILSVSNACGITVMDSVKIMFNPPPTLAFFSDTVNICAPGIIHFSDQSVTGNPADPISSWNWNFGDGGVSALPDPAYIYNTSGTYTVTLTVTTDAGCTASSVNPIVIHAFPSPSAGFTMNTNYLDIPYDVLHCNNTSSGASVYDWQFGDGATSTSFNVSHLYQSIGNYGVQLIATNQYGCRDTAFADVTTHADVVFPNAFTPNPNGAPGGVYDIASLTNDIFFPYTSGVVDFKLQIYDRWGELIFESEDVKIGWDGYYKGKLCQLGVYVWKAYVKLNNGKEFNKSGDVTLLR